MATTISAPSWARRTRRRRGRTSGPAARSLVQPSAYLHEWRLAAWRDLFARTTPGHREYLDSFEHPERFGPLLTGSLWEELAGNSDDELLTVNVAYAWRKP